MKRKLLSMSLLISALTATAAAGTLEGKAPAGNSVVYVDAIPGKTFPVASKTVVISQRGLAYVPHIMAIEQGTTVDFQNDDSVQHNVFWPSISGNKKDGHNMGTWPKGDKRSFTFDHAGIVPLLCNVHSEMSGFLIVSPTPYFAQTDSAGNFKIDNVPDGKYTVVVWHEGSKLQSTSVEVSGTGKVDFAAAK